MNVLYFKAGALTNLSEHTIYTDLLKEFKRNGHEVYAIAASERRKHKGTSLSIEEGIHVLRVKTGNITKCGMIEKGISTLLFEHQYITAIKKYFNNVRFDLALYSTPPITAVGVVKYLKKKNNVVAYLMLKDIFPQNAVDLGMMKDHGIKGLIYKYFRNKEKALYCISDYIGCMSKANIDYLTSHNPKVDRKKIGTCKNSIDAVDMSVNENEAVLIRKKYGIPLNKIAFIYGGNLGKPQGIKFMLECLKKQSSERSFFLIVGDGTEYDSIKKTVKECKIQNVKLLKRLPKEDYDRLVAACDIGLIFLDYRFTIPNYPSRLLAYLQAKLPVYAITDEHSDIGQDILEHGIGWWSLSNNSDEFCKTIRMIEEEDIRYMREKSWNVLVNEFNIRDTYREIIRLVKQ